MALSNSSRWTMHCLIGVVLFSLLLSGCLPTKQADLPSVTVGVRGASADAPAKAQDQAPVPSPPLPEAQQPPVPTPSPAVPADLPAPSPPPSVPPEQGSSPSLGDPAKGTYPISPSDPYAFLGIGGLTVKRTSRDKGELKEMQLIVRNIGTYGFIPIVYMTFEEGVTGGSVQPRILEQKFELPYLEPGMKVEEWYPVSMYFHEIDKEKTIRLRIQEKYLSPPYDFEHFELTFIPRDEFKSEEISWT